MKWDNSTNPPRAWKIEDGNVVFLGDDELAVCQHCGTRFERDPYKDKPFCSPRCSLAATEANARSQTKNHNQTPE